MSCFTSALGDSSSSLSHCVDIDVGNKSEESEMTIDTSVSFYNGTVGKKTGLKEFPYQLFKKSYWKGLNPLFQSLTFQEPRNILNRSTVWNDFYCRLDSSTWPQNHYINLEIYIVVLTVSRRKQKSN